MVTEKLLLLLAAVAIATGSPVTGSKEKPSKSDAPAGKDKLSREEIMFGNQQNKPPGMVDDILAFPDRTPGNSDNSTEKKNTTQHTSFEGHATEGDGKDNTRKVERGLQEQEPSKFDYYDYLDDDTHLTDDNYRLVPTDDEGDYQYDDGNTLYRRKRTLPRSFRDKRNLRSSMEELLTGGKRLSRRALRPKREINMDELMAFMLGAQADGRLGRDNLVPEKYRFVEEVAPNNDIDFRYPYDSTMDEDDMVSAVPEDASPIVLTKEVPEWFPSNNPLTMRGHMAYFNPQQYRQLAFQSQRQAIPKWEDIPQRPLDITDEDEDEAERLYELATLLQEIPEKNRHWK